MSMHLPKRLVTIQKAFSLKKAMFAWYRYYKLFFFFGFLVVLGIGGYFWYKNLYHYQWSEETKKAYIEQHFKETRFNERGFSENVRRLDARAQSSTKDPVFFRDIFSGKPLY